MKTTATQDKPPFSPIKLEITLETKEEAEFFACLFNWTPIVDTAQKRGVKVYDISEVLIRNGVSRLATTGLAQEIFAHPAVQAKIKY